MTTEVWIRNPRLCIRELVEVNHGLIAWDIGMLLKFGIDPIRFANLYFPAGFQWRMLVIGNPDQGATEIVPGTTLDRPKIVHPVWEYGDPIGDLEQHLSDGKMVVVTQLPVMNQSLGKSFLRTLAELQEENPEGEVYLHGLYGFNPMFAHGFAHADYDPRTLAQKGKVVIPAGQEMTFERAAENPGWVTLLNVHPVDLKIPRNRCMFNIKSAIWAGKFWNEIPKFKTKFDPDAEVGRKPAQGQQIMMRRKNSEYGDKFLCDTCSLQLSCRYYRERSVCIVPGSEPAELAAYFKTRDSGSIIEGLGTLMALNTQRLKEGREREAEMDEGLDPHVSKLIQSIFDSGVKLAKLVDPALAKAGAPQTNVQINQQTINASTPQALMSAIVSQLEARGVPRNQITPDMVRELMGMSEDRRQQAIEATAIDNG